MFKSGEGRQKREEMRCEGIDEVKGELEEKEERR